MQAARTRAQAAIRAMLECADAATAQRTAQLLACLFWRDRAAPARAAAQTLLQAKRLPDSTTLGTASLLPAAPSPQSHSAPLVDTLGDVLRDPARARLAADVFINALGALLATFLQSKGATGGTSSSSNVLGSAASRVRSSAQHVFIAAATLSVAAQWLRVLPQRAQQAPMLRLALMMFEMLTVPRPPDDADSARHRGSGGAAGQGVDASSPASQHLSPLSLFLSGASVNTSLLCQCALAMLLSCSWCELLSRLAGILVCSSPSVPLLNKLTKSIAMHCCVVGEFASVLQVPSSCHR